MRFCAEYSRDSGEQLFGTAKPTQLWLLIEHSGRWETKAEDSLPPAAKSAIERLKANTLGLKLGLIRRNARASEPISCFLALSREAGSGIFPFSIGQYDDLQFVDVERILNRRPSGRRIILVCTHGTHDRCCAKFGHSLYESMRAAAGDDVWQVSHLGGCRFAPNVVCLPEGLVYGRVQPADCLPLAEAWRAGHVIPRLLRGRCCYPKPVQAAEYFLRSERNEYGALKLHQATEKAAGEWEIVFQLGFEKISVRLTAAPSAVSTYKSCSAPDPFPRPQFRLLECTSEARTNPVPETYRRIPNYGM